MIFKILCPSKDDALSLMKEFAEHGIISTLYPQPIYRCSPPSTSTDSTQCRIWEDYEINVEFEPPGYYYDDYYNDGQKKETIDAFEKIYREVFKKLGNKLRLSGEYIAIDSVYHVLNP